MRVLRLQDLSTGLGVLVVEEATSVRQFGLVPVLFEIFHLEPLAPRVGEGHGAGAVVFDVTLAAGDAAHFGAGGIAVAEFAVDRHDGGMAVHAGAGLRFGQAFGRLLILGKNIACHYFLSDRTAEIFHSARSEPD